MHLILAICLFFFALWKGNWREWEKYTHTIFYVIICNLLYNVLCQDHLLWEYNPDFLPESHVLVDIIYSFISLPALTLLFLTFYPYSKPISKQIRYLLIWVISSLAVEYPFIHYERLVLNHGYKYWMDFFFYIVMYGMIRLHYSRPFLTYGISVLIISFMLWYFNVPIK